MRVRRVESVELKQFANAIRDLLGLEPLVDIGAELRKLKTREEEDMVRFHRDPTCWTSIHQYGAPIPTRQRNS